MRISPISFKARFTNNQRYQYAKEGAYWMYAEKQFQEGEELLASDKFPKHKLKLLKDGFLNVTTKKTHKFPWAWAEHMSSAQNALLFFRELNKPDSEFVKNLFEV